VKKYIKSKPWEFRDSFVYIHVGPVRFTRMLRSEGRREVALVVSRNYPTPTVFWTEISDILTQYSAKVVLCTLYPMDFWCCNNSYARAFGTRRGRQVLKEMYSPWNDKIKGMVVVENRGIVAFNERNSFITPFVHKSVFVRRRRHYVFRSDRFLEDGIHPTSVLKDNWTRELRRAHAANIRRHVRVE